MLFNASAVLHSNDTTYTFPYAYKYDKKSSEINTNGIIRKTEKVLYIYQENTSTDLMTLNVTVGKDYFTFTGDSKKYTIISFVDGMYGSPNMQHMEFTLG